MDFRTREKLQEFNGFTADDFAIFEIPGFMDRMPRIRQQITPKLAAIGESLGPVLSERLGAPLFPHVAQHLRRTVNPPEWTWVAFARTARAYKPYVHYRVALSAENVRIVLFVEDDALDKPVFANNLERNADSLSDYLEHHPQIHAYELTDESGAPKFGRTLDASTLRAFAERLKRRKGQHANFGIPFAPVHPVLASGAEFLDAAMAAALTLKPFYLCGAAPDYIYTPETERIAIVT